MFKHIFVMIFVMVLIGCEVGGKNSLPEWRYKEIGDTAVGLTDGLNNGGREMLGLFCNKREGARITMALKEGMGAIFEKGYNIKIQVDDGGSELLSHNISKEVGFTEFEMIDSLGIMTNFAGGKKVTIHYKNRLGGVEMVQFSLNGYNEVGARVLSFCNN